jgi:hypothetical protein
LKLRKRHKKKLGNKKKMLGKLRKRHKKKLGNKKKKLGNKKKDKGSKNKFSDYVSIRKFLILK